jgi:uncharacterized repeat protein (TIGR01451 family)
MGAWKQGRTAVVGGAAVAAVWAVVALAAPAQPSAPFYPLPPGATAAKLEFRTEPEPQTAPEPLPPLNMPPASEVVPAGFNQPARQPGPARPVSGVTGRPGADVTDPAYPVVTIRVRVPADVPPGDDIKYVITVQNASAADAHAVTVRNPLPSDATFVKADPEPDKPQGSDKLPQLVWSFGTLKGGATKTIELVLRHKPDVKELKNLAYVRFEHGEAVTTKIAKPTIKVAMAAPKQTVRDEPYTVRVTIENTGRVAAKGVRVLENLPASAEVEAVTAGGKRLQQPTGQQWEWEFAKLQPGERKTIEYRVTPREAKDVLALTSVAGEHVVADRPVEAQTQVLVPGLEVKLTGPKGVVNAGESAKYEIVVRNSGTLPSTNIKVTGTIPADCKPTMKTDGGQVYRDTIVWQLPRLDPGEAQSYRFALKANTTGRRVVSASASDARGMTGAQELPTVFTGTAALTWESTFSSLTVGVGKQGTFVVKVKNHGGEAARNVRVQIDAPSAVSVVMASPQTRFEANPIVFGPDTIAGNSEATYTITFRGEKADNAFFNLSMTADCLGDKPLTTQKSINVLGGK